MTLLGAFVNGRPWTLATNAFALATAVLNDWHWSWSVIAGVGMLLNLYSWDYQRRHGWPMPDDEQD